MVRREVKRKRFILKGIRLRVAIGKYMCLERIDRKAKIEWIAWFQRTGGFGGSIRGKTIREVVGKLRLEIAEQNNPKVRDINRRVRGK